MYWIQLHYIIGKVDQIHTILTSKSPEIPRQSYKIIRYHCHTAPKMLIFLIDCESNTIAQDC